MFFNKKQVLLKQNKNYFKSHQKNTNYVHKYYKIKAKYSPLETPML